MATKKTTVKRSPKTGAFVPAHSSSSPRTTVKEKEILSFYNMSTQKAAKSVKASGVLTEKGRLKRAFK